MLPSLCLFCNDFNSILSASNLKPAEKIHEQYMYIFLGLPIHMMVKNSRTLYIYIYIYIYIYFKKEKKKKKKKKRASFRVLGTPNIETKN